MMDTLHHLIKFFLKIAVAFFIFAFVWWIAALFFPPLSVKSLLATHTKNAAGETAKKDWLPSPKQYKGLFADMQPPSEYNNVYVHPGAYDGYNLGNETYKYSNNSYVTYTSTGTSITGGGVYNEKTGVVEFPTQTGSQGSATTTKPGQPNTTPKGLYIRNLSIYEKGHVYTGLSFIGEARSSMFKDGRFPIVVIDAARRVVGVSTAYATSDWTVPGWIRFETKINYALPNNVPCTMIFEEALTQVERTRQPVRIPVAVQCN